MWLQHPIDIYRRKGDLSFIGHTSFYEGVLDEANLFFCSSRMKQHFPLPPRVVLVIYWTSVYIVNDNLKGFQRCRVVRSNFRLCRISFLACCADILFKVPGPDEFFHQVMQTLALFSGVAMIPMVRAPSVPVSYIRIYLDWLWRSEVQ